MTDEQIIKALELCGTRGVIECSKCPYGEVDGCYVDLFYDAIALIKRQREEIEKLIDECGSQSVLWRDNFASVYETAKETIKAEARAEAIRELAERVDGVLDLFAKGLIEELELYDKIAELKREMTEEQK